MAGGIDSMDAPLREAVRLAGGRRALARKLGIARMQRWTRVRQSQLFAVAKVTGLDPRALRPDLTAWIDAEILRRQLAATDGGAAIAELAESLGSRWDGPILDAGLTDLWASLAAVRWVARERRLKVQALCYGRDDAAQEARSYAMALAHVAGRASSTHVANVFGCSRQNVDNASERYIRARDGDEAEDHIQGEFGDGRPRVWESGSNRLRLAKGPDPDLWAAEARFESFLRGEDLAAIPEPKRRRA